MKGVAVAYVVVLACAAAGVGAQQCVRRANGWSCAGHRHCCSASGWCGKSVDYCGDGCRGGNCLADRMCGRQAGGASCWNNRCCSQHGWCGVDDAYCGSGCQNGPCTPRKANTTAGVAAVVTRDLFDHMLPRGASCPARRFYTYNTFIAAADAFPAFAADGDDEARKREVAAFLAHNPGGYCHKEANVSTSDDYCVPTAQWPCVPGKKYHARGPMQIAYNYNYGPAGRAIGANLLDRPDLVTTDPIVAFQTAIWLWMTSPSPGQLSLHDAFAASLALASP